MDIWKILGIDATKDKELLKRTYRAKLVGYNPEDDPEGFMKLREAYEEALRLADSSEEAHETDELSGGVLGIVIDELYSDFNKRISPEAWQELFDRDEFVSLDTEEEAFDTLMKYLMDNFHLPQKIWKLISDTFDIAGRKKELSEIYPGDFIEYILNNSTYEDILNYYLFDGDESEFDEFIETYYRLDIAIRKREIDNQEALIEEISDMDVYHPYLDICRFRHEIQIMGQEAEKLMSDDSVENEDEDILIARMFSSELSDIQNKAKGLCENFPEDIFLINACGDVAMVRMDYQEAKQYYDRTLELAPDNYMVKGKQAELLFCLGEYEKARDAYLDLLKINHFDNNVRAGMIRANYKLIDQLKEKIKANPEDNKSRMEMAWSYYQSYNFQEAIAVLDEFTPKDEDVCEYYNVKGRTYLCLMDYDKALKCFEIWKGAILDLPSDDVSEDTQNKRKRYEYVNFLMADCYLKLKNYDKSREHLDIALAKEHEEIVLSYEARCELEYEMGEYESCIKACEELLDRDDRSYIGYNYMSKAFYDMGYFKECISACEHAISIYPYVSEPYCLEACVFLKVDQPDTARSVLDRYRIFGIDSDRLDYHEARILVYEDKLKEAVKLINETLKRRTTDEESDMDDYSDLFMLLGFCYEDLDERELAYKQFEQAAGMSVAHKAAYGKMAALLRDAGKYEEAVEMYTKQLEYNQDAVYYINRGMLQNYLSNYKSALADFKMALKLEPENAYCHLRIGLIYENHREFEKALSHYDMGISYIYPDDENSKDRLANLYALKARCLQCMNRFEDSKNVYEYYFEQFELNADVAYDYSELCVRMNRLDLAEDILNRCINTLEYSEDLQAAIRQLCSLYGNEGYIDKANECFLLAISKNPNDARAYASMGEVFINHGLYDRAKEMYQKAIMLDDGDEINYYSRYIEAILSKKALIKPDVRMYISRAMIPENEMTNPMDYLKMARLYRMLKKPMEAKKVLEKGVRIKRCNGCFYSKCHELWYEWALLCESIRDYKTARKCYRQALIICGHNALYEERLKRIENK